VVFICSFLFFLGVLFGYFIIAPFAVNFLAGYTIPGVENSPTLNSFINYMIMFTAPAGLIFELPVLVFFLTKIGLLSSDTMRTYRRHSIIVILLLSAIITPPDVITQFLIAIPLSVLYEISIWIAKRVERKEAEESLT
jgi:sec-independent protein translocase protein TatC